MSRITSYALQRPLATMRRAAITAGLLAAVADAQGCLETTFASNHVSGGGASHFFDVNVKNPRGLKITAVSVNCTAPPNTVVTGSVWTTAGTWVGKDTDVALWVGVASGHGPAKGKDRPTRIPLNPNSTKGFFLPPGRHGLCVYLGATPTASTSGTTRYGNADLDVALGSERSAFFGGTRIPKITWNGRICYAADGAAAAGASGVGCPSAPRRLQSRLGVSANPVLGTTVLLRLFSLPTAPGAGWLLVGHRRARWDLTPIGMPGCARLNDAAVVVGFTHAGGAKSIPAAIPDDRSLIGTIAYAQAANAAKGANPLGVLASNGFALRIGR